MSGASTGRRNIRDAKISDLVAVSLWLHFRLRPRKCRSTLGQVASALEQNLYIRWPSFASHVTGVADMLLRTCDR
jgi:hypothetical protein